MVVFFSSQNSQSSDWRVNVVVIVASLVDGTGLNPSRLGFSFSLQQARSYDHMSERETGREQLLCQSAESARRFPSEEAQLPGRRRLFAAA